MAWVIDAAGWIDAATHVPSPNCDDRPPHQTIDLVVLHAISLPPGQFGGPHIAELFQNRLDARAHPYFATISTLRVSAHFLVDRLGRLIQFVPCLRRAWHAGVSSWRGRPCCNDFSLGIELEGCDTETFTAAQYITLNRLLAALLARYPIRDIAGHCHIAPERKTDPGPLFDWHRVQNAAVITDETRPGEC